MLTNTPCTLFQYCKDVSGQEQWTPLVFPACLWTPKTETVPTSEGFKKNALVTVFIRWEDRPAGRTYLGPKAYASLPFEERAGYFTFCPMKDRIAKGIYGEMEAADLLALDDCFTLQSVSFFEYGLKHWEVNGK